VWDHLGRALFSSAVYDYPVTSLKWSPDGMLFAAGSYNAIRLCDHAGWSHSLEKVETGSILGISWTDDSTQLALAASNGKVIVASVIER
jgi:intraflagellar transport protein 80